MASAAFFDLDGTLLAVNSGTLWLRRERRAGRVSLGQAARGAAWLAGYKIGVVDIERALTEALGTIRGMAEQDVRRATLEWWGSEVASKAAPGGLAAVEAHRRRGDRLVLLTSSSPYASEAACRQFGLDDVLCTRYEVEGGRFTGRPVRPVCFGPGKVELAEALARRRGLDLASCTFYTDSCTDLPMLLRVGHPRAVNPDPRLRWQALRRGWPVLDWRRT